MKSLGSLVLSIIVGIIVLVLTLKLLGAALKLFGILIAIAVVAIVYFVLRGMMGGGGRRG